MAKAAVSRTRSEMPLPDILIQKRDGRGNSFYFLGRHCIGGGACSGVVTWWS